VRPREASRLYGLGRTQLFELLRQKRLESTKVGRARLILVESLEKLIHGNAT
jgi:excisionase family DNA binding protein